MTETLTGGMYLTRLLETYGTDTVFGIPGVHTVELYRGLEGTGIRHITPRHEQGAGFMADGYARATGRPGVCYIISGPGMTNMITPMGQAYGDSIPMLVISTVNAHGRMGSGDGWLHELPDQRGLTAGVTAFSRTIHAVEEIAPTLAQAFALFASGRPRPVHIELPINIITAPAGHLPPPRAMARPYPPAPAPDALSQAADWLCTAKRPVILAGGGTRWSTGLPALAEALDAPVVMTTNARGLLPPEHPLAVSLSPSMPETRAMVTEADVVLALGTELGRTDYDMYETGGFKVNGRLIRVEIDPVQMARNQSPDLALIADTHQAIAALTAKIPPRPAQSGAARAAAAMTGIAALAPAIQGDLALLNAIRKAAPEAIIVGDSTQAAYAATLGFSAAGPGQFFSGSTGFGTLGLALPAAIGAAIGSGRPVIALVGDGGLQFSAPEMASAVEAGADVTVLLYDNQGYGEIKSYMQANEIATIGVDLYTPDLPALARASGWQAETVETPQTLIDALEARTGPILLRYTDKLRDAFRTTI